MMRRIRKEKRGVPAIEKGNVSGNSARETMLGESERAE